MVYMAGRTNREGANLVETATPLPGQECTPQQALNLAWFIVEYWRRAVAFDGLEEPGIDESDGQALILARALIHQFSLATVRELEGKP